MIDSVNPIRRRMMLALAALAAAGRPARAAAGGIRQAAGKSDKAYIERAFEMRQHAIASGDQAFGAVVVRDGVIVGQAPSRVVTAGDPTAHAEMEAIRDAARRLGGRDLGGCTLYSSSPPCPMCEAAAYWAGIGDMVYGRDATRAGTQRLCG